MMDMTFSSYPPAEIAHGSFLAVLGAGFVPGSPNYTCRLASRRNASRAIETAPTAPRSTSRIECSVPLWPYAAENLSVVVLRNGQPLPARANLSLQILPAWTHVALPREVSYQGGHLLTVFGAGFDPDLRPGYLCQFSDAGGGACRAEDPGCLAANSSETRVPPAMRGPSPAAGFDAVTCYTPAWLHRGRRATLRLLVNQTFVRQVLTTAVRTTFAGLPTIGSGPYNGPVRGGSPVNVSGQEFGLVDLSPRTRIAPSACQSTRWTSSTALVCFLPSLSPGDGSGLRDMVVSVAPHRTSTRNASFTFDGPLFAPPVASQPRNGPALRAGPRVNATFLLSGAGFGETDLTAALRVGGTAAESTQWVASSSVAAKLGAGA